MGKAGSIAGLAKEAASASVRVGAARARALDGEAVACGAVACQPAAAALRNSMVVCGGAGVRKAGTIAGLVRSIFFFHSMKCEFTAEENYAPLAQRILEPQVERYHEPLALRYACTGPACVLGWG